MSLPLGFSSEWRTFGQHRVFLDVRDGFPGRYLRRVAARAAFWCSHLLPHTRLAQVFYDDTNGVVNLALVTDAASDLRLAEAFWQQLTFLEEGGLFGEIYLVPPDPHGNSDHYDRMRYLAERFFSVERPLPALQFDS